LVSAAGAQCQPRHTESQTQWPQFQGQLAACHTHRGTQCMQTISQSGGSNITGHPPTPPQSHPQTKAQTPADRIAPLYVMQHGHHSHDHFP
jgi:hypothetical protein